jgi:hypothetical protein
MITTPRLTFQQIRSFSNGLRQLAMLVQSLRDVRQQTQIIDTA